MGLLLYSLSQAIIYKSPTRKKTQHSKNMMRSVTVMVDIANLRRKEKRRTEMKK